MAELKFGLDDEGHRRYLTDLKSGFVSAFLATTISLNYSNSLYGFFNNKESMQGHRIEVLFDMKMEYL